MKKRYIFLIISICIAVSIVLIGKTDYTREQKFIEETKEDLKDQKSQQDSLFALTDEVLEQVVQNQEESENIIGEFEEKVKDNELTIEQQITELKQLLKEANDAKKKAQEHEEMAIKVKQEADLAKMMAQEEQQKALMAYKQLQEQFDSLQVEYDKLLQQVSDMNSIGNGNDIIIEDAGAIDDNFDKKKDKKDKKKKKN